ncbi:MAG: transcription antitermination factor NusB [Nitrospirae bacterium]|nr:transcription antitermination factor NusB [Nitrospirota bacterium]
MSLYRRAREYALQILFQLDVTGGQFNDKTLEDFWRGIKEEDSVREFANEIVVGTRQNIEKIDEVIKETAEQWSIGRMAIVDRNMLRAAAYELLFRPEIPASVVMDEAIEISKKYSTEDSSAFINGILDKIQRLRTAS